MKTTLIISIACLTFSLVGCSQDASKKHKRSVITISPTLIKQSLAFSSTVRPIQLQNIPSPVNGLVKQLYFDYGSLVEKNQPLITIESESLQKEYQTNLADFISKKTQWLNAQLKFKGTKRLKKEGIIAENDFLAEQSSFNNTYVTYLEATWKLQALLKTLGLSFKKIDSLDVRNKGDLYKALTAKANTLTITAPDAGIVLLPSKSGSNDSNSQQLEKGSQLKKNQTLLAIGNMRGMQLLIDVDEIHINQIKPQQAVTITSVAFPGMTLKGQVTSISHQAKINNTSGLPTFTVVVVVPHLPEAAKHTIQVGMTTTVTLHLSLKRDITIPLNALTQKSSHYFVTTLSDAGKNQSIAVVPGETQLNTVTIKQGLKPGDQLVIPH